MKILYKASVVALIFIILSSFSISAQDNPLLWKITGKDLQKPSYLFGTFHILCPEDMNLNETVTNAILETDVLVMELDMDDPQMMQKMTKLMMNPGGKNFAENLEEEEIEVLNAFFQKNYGATMSQLGFMKPFALLSMMYPKALDCPTMGSYEKSIAAFQEERELLGLETVESQMALFDNIPVEEQINWLLKYAKDTVTMKKEMKEMVDLYKTGDVKKLHEHVVNNPEMKNHLDQVLYERNIAWIPVIEGIIKNKSAFIAVGAGHLGSEQGVIELLKKAGYEVQRVK